MALPMIEAKAISKSARIGIGAAMQILMILLWGFGADNCEALIHR